MSVQRYNLLGAKRTPSSFLPCLLKMRASGPTIQRQLSGKQAWPLANRISRLPLFLRSYSHRITSVVSSSYLFSPKQTYSSDQMRNHYVRG